MGAKSKKPRADAVYAKKTAKKSNPFETAKAHTSKRLNPFDVHVNKEKFQILGRICKHDRGVPGISRAKALDKRAKTLGAQYAVKNKTNKFNDNRIGRKFNSDQVPESVLNARFLAEKLSQVRASHKTEKFNLNDDEVLTHKGQTLEEIEQYRDERSDDEELDDERLDADFTAAAHFGGDGDSPQDRQAAIEEMIIEQKRRKNEIAKEKDEVHEMTEKLDASYKSLLNLVGKATKDEQRAKPPPDDYDKLLKQMIFEPRGSVTDKLINPDELAKQEVARLERLENERLRRMKADGEEEVGIEKPSHRSADDLDDGYFMSAMDEDDNALAYNLEGKLHGSKPEGDASNDEENATGDEGENVEEDDGDDDDDSGDSESDEVDNFSDLKESDSESELDEPTVAKVQKQTKPIEKEASSIDSTVPYVIKMPNTYAAFDKLLKKYTDDQRVIVVQRLVKCTYPKLQGVNSGDCIKLYAFLLQYFKESFADANEYDVKSHYKLFHQLIPSFYDLTLYDLEGISTNLIEVIKEKFTEFDSNPKVFPALDTIFMFTMVGNVYSTSDFRHSIVTPCYIFIQHILSNARVRTRQDITMGLSLVASALQYCQSSKRWLPAVYNYLEGIIHMCVPKRKGQKFVVPPPPFHSVGPFSNLLVISNSPDNKAIEQEDLQDIDFVTCTITPEFKVRALESTLHLLQQAIELICEHPGLRALVPRLLPLINQLPMDRYPDYVHENYETVKASLEQLAQLKALPLRFPDKKPKALRLLEPRIEVVYDDKRRPKMSKAKEERVKLLHKIKREKKGAMREIRRDTAYLQELQLKQTIQSDKERHEKVKRIYQEASMQQGELNELARSKKKKKF